MSSNHQGGDSPYLGSTRSRRVGTGESAVRTCEAIKGRIWESEESVEARVRVTQRC